MEAGAGQLAHDPKTGSARTTTLFHFPNLKMLR
jgi:hypothetical protein